jgi:hypothetical protein
MNKFRFGWMVALCGLLALGCGDDKEDTDSQGGPIEVMGEWESTFGDMTFRESITEEAWGFADLIEYDNAENVAITKSPDFDDPSIETYSRLVWLEPQGSSFYYCTAAFGLETLEEARDSKAKADSSNPDEGGCGDSDFPWTKLEKTE